MREKVLTWLPAILCTLLTVMTFVLYVVTATILKGDPRIPIFAILIPLLLGLPQCFFHVEQFLSQLRQENRLLRVQIQELIAKSDVGKHAA